uniref:IS3 family transposase n=1 Tax=Peribacillus sp. FSL P2-0133 TaxID=2921573 RepID=UPI001155678E
MWKAKGAFSIPVVSNKGNCLDNACVESFFSHFKTEMLYQIDCKKEEELIQAIETYMYHYYYK